MSTINRVLTSLICIAGTMLPCNVEAQVADPVSIVIYRPDRFSGALMRPEVFFDDTLCLRVRNGEYFEYRGRRPRKIAVGKSAIVLPNDSASEFFVRLQIESHFLYYSPVLLLVDRSFGRAAYEEFKTRKAHIIPPERLKKCE